MRRRLTTEYLPWPGGVVWVLYVMKTFLGLLMTLLGLALCLSLPSRAQTYFNRRYALGTAFSGFTSLVANDSGYLQGKRTKLMRGVFGDIVFDRML
jgi:hypothetical protein